MNKLYSENGYLTIRDIKILGKLNLNNEEIISFDSIIGTTGPTGHQGLQGDVGPTGHQGLQGDVGPTGHQGLQGDVGPTGHQGLQGDVGPTGHQGLQGDVGHTGNQGPQGEFGPQGLKGDVGNTGPTGQKGNSFNIFTYINSIDELTQYNDIVYGDFILQNGGYMYEYIGSNLGDIGENDSYLLRSYLGTTGPIGPTGNIGPIGPGLKLFQISSDVNDITPSQDNYGQFCLVNSDLYYSNGSSLTLISSLNDASNLIGFTGSTGPYGPQGEIGPQGPQGEIGQQGQNGPAGQGFQIFAINTDLDNITPTEEDLGNFALISVTSDLYMYAGNDGNTGPNNSYIFASNIQNASNLYGFTGPVGLNGDIGPTGPTGSRGLIGEPGKGIIIFGKEDDINNSNPTSENLGELLLVENTLYIYVGNNNGNFGNNNEYNLFSAIENLSNIVGPQGPSGINGNDFIYTLNDISNDDNIIIKNSNSILQTLNINTENSVHSVDISISFLTPGTGLVRLLIVNDNKTIGNSVYTYGDSSINYFLSVSGKFKNNTSTIKIYNDTDGDIEITSGNYSIGI
jgi:hypothetical protein